MSSSGLFLSDVYGQRVCSECSHGLAALFRPKSYKNEEVSA